MTYDNEGRLKGWQNTPTSPSTTVGFLYDNAGNRVEQQVIQNGTTTTTLYVGKLEQVSTTGGSTTTTTYYYANGQRIALAVNGVFSYFGSDGLGSAVVALNASGSATASMLYAPYGGVRYGSGTMPTDYGFTGQRADAATGLDYYNARYYDPVAGQFASADSILPGSGYDAWGLSRYAYVEGNPEVRIDAGGHSGNPLCEGRCDTYAESQSTPASTNNGACGGSASWGLRCQEAVSLSPAERLQIMHSFFDAYPGSSTEDQIGGLGEGILSFTEWEISSGRLDLTSGSQYWRAANGLMALDMRDAQSLLKDGQTVSNNPGVQGWIDYANMSQLHVSIEQKQRFLWKAH